jgi:hypothetical protein
LTWELWLTPLLPPYETCVSHVKSREKSLADSSELRRWYRFMWGRESPCRQQIRTYGSNLPPSWRTLYQLTGVTLPLLEEAMKDPFKTASET